MGFLKKTASSREKMESFAELFITRHIRQTLFKRGLPNMSSYKQFWKKLHFFLRRCRLLKEPHFYKTSMRMRVSAKDPVFCCVWVHIDVYAAVYQVPYPTTNTLMYCIGSNDEFMKYPSQITHKHYLFKVNLWHEISLSSKLHER